jgi:hypothetical protein
MRNSSSQSPSNLRASAQAATKWLHLLCGARVVTQARNNSELLANLGNFVNRWGVQLQVPACTLPHVIDLRRTQLNTAI